MVSKMDDLVVELRKRKVSLMDRVESNINRYIISTGKNCIAVVERDDNGKACVQWDFSDDLDDFFKRLYLFMRKKNAPSGRALDSALTDPIVDIVKDDYQKFYESETEAISMGLLKALAADEIKLKSFLNRIADIALKSASSEVKKKIVNLLTRQIKESINQGAMHNVGQQIGHLATTTAGAQVAQVVAHLLMKLLLTHMSTIIAKVLASAALQHAIFLVAKKLVVTAVTAAVLKILIAHFGAALAGASVMWIVIPLIAGYMAYKIATFPEELGKAVSRDVRKELDNGFDGMNKTVLEKIFDAVFGGNELVRAIAKDKEFQSALIEVGESLDSRLGRKKGRDMTVKVKEIRI